MPLPCVHYNTRSNEILSLRERFKKNLIQTAVGFILISVLSIFFIAIQPKNNLIQNTPTIPSNAVYTGTITKILSSKEILDNNKNKDIKQELEIEFNNGRETKKIITTNYTTATSDKNYNIGDSIVLNVDERNSSNPYTLMDKYRLNNLIVIALIFAISACLLSGFRGFNSLIGLLFSILVISQFTIPYIVSGANSVMVSMITIFVIAVTGVFVAHGFNRKTAISVISILITCMLAILFSYIAIYFTQLSGIGDEDQSYIKTIPGLENINLQGLLLAGIIIGTLGVLDDVVTGQVAVADEIARINTTLKTNEVFWRCMNVGREHIASLINTLFLAYAGSNLPIFIIFYTYQYEPLWSIINREFIAQEAVRTLSGSMALLFAIPIATFLASVYFTHIYRNADMAKSKELFENFKNKVRTRDEISFTKI
jgi:uncharacterized membrane protein